MYSQLILCQVVILLSLEFHTASCDTFYIVPTPSSHCPGEFTGVPCLTLQQYASNPSQSQNITFLVESGTYNLSTRLTVSNGYNFTMSSTNATVVCTSSTAQFIFNTVENVHISGMTFQRCRHSNGAIQMSSIMRANFVNCHFIENNRGGALQMSSITMSSIENCHFIGYDNIYNSGRALYVYYSTVSISDCRFQNNYADQGGAIYAWSSHITINGSTFNYNRAYYRYGRGGGGIYSSFSTVMVDNTTFSRNNARSGGGAIYHYRGNIHVTNTVFSDNRAASGSGGAIYMNMYTYPYYYRYVIIIIGCQFINNYASRVSNRFSDDSGNRTLPRPATKVCILDCILLLKGLSLAVTCRRTMPPASTSRALQPFKGRVRKHQRSDKGICIRIDNQTT